MNNWRICWFSRIFLLRILIFKGLTARRVYKAFGVNRLIVVLERNKLLVYCYHICAAFLQLYIWNNPFSYGVQPTVAAILCFQRLFSLWTHGTFTVVLFVIYVHYPLWRNSYSGAVMVRGFGGLNPPKFRSFDKGELISQFCGIFHVHPYQPNQNMGFIHLQIE
jgi:hypothetical protein